MPPQKENKQTVYNVQTVKMGKDGQLYHRTVGQIREWYIGEERKMALDLYMFPNTKFICKEQRES